MMIKEEQLKAERLYKQYSRLMIRVAFDILHDYPLAEDALSQAFLKVIKNLHKIDEKNCTKTKHFLVIICRNAAITIYNERSYLNSQNNSIDELEDETSDAMTNPAEIVLSKESVNAVIQAILSLKPIYQDIILLKCFHNFNYKEIAELLSLPANTVRKRATRAKNMLSQALNKEAVK